MIVPTDEATITRARPWRDMPGSYGAASLVGTEDRERGAGTEALYRDDGDSSTRCRSLGMTRAFSPSPVARRPSPVACRQSPVACRPSPFTVPNQPFTPRGTSIDCQNHGRRRRPGGFGVNNSLSQSEQPTGRTPIRRNHRVMIGLGLTALVAAGAATGRQD